MQTANQSEILFLWDAKMTNPNGDMLNDNAPRYDEADRKAIVSDVRVKRTIRDDLQMRQNETIFVNNSEDIVSAESRFKEIEKLTNKKELKSIFNIMMATTFIALFFTMFGTILGGIWGDQSWGRFWGWDPKETWALVTILVYTVVVHLRFVKSMRGIFAFNVASLLAFSSVVMTYFGVNYYLSGMHSYAKGDPVPIPTFVYYVVAIVVITIILAYRKRELLPMKKK